MGNENYNAGLNQASNRPMSRIDHMVERVKNFTIGVESATDRIVMHARTFGYFEPTTDAKSNSPTPVVTTLEDALAELGRALDKHSGSLNLFD